MAITGANNPITPSRSSTRLAQKHGAKSVKVTATAEKNTTRTNKPSKSKKKKVSDQEISGETTIPQAQPEDVTIESKPIIFESKLS